MPPLENNLAATQSPVPDSVCVVLPAYNEEQNLGPLLERIDEALGTMPIPYRVIVVDDGSQDGTSKIIAESARKFPVSSVTHLVNAGLGHTIRDGLLEAVRVTNENCLIVTMDSDESHDPELIHAMVEMIRGGPDVVIASRYQKGAEIRGLSQFRKILSLGASYLMRVTNPIAGVRDYTCGFRAYRKAALRKAIDKYGTRFVEARGFHCMAEILLKMGSLNLSFGEVPMTLRYDLKKGQSKMRMLQTVRQTLLLALRRRAVNRS